MTKIIDTTFERFKSYFNELGFTNSLRCLRSYSFDFYKGVNDVQYEISFCYINKGKGFSINGNINSFIVCLDVVKILKQFIELNSFEKITVLKFPNYDKNIDDPSLIVNGPHK